jgi:spore coat protein U-like protein
LRGSLNLFKYLMLICIIAIPGVRGCSISIQPVNFGHYNPASGVDTTSTGEIMVTCNPETNYRIGIDRGGHLDSSIHGNGRLMTHMSDGYTLLYNIFKDPEYALIWGETEAYDDISGTAGVNVQHIVYGKMPKGQNSTPGIYGDSLSVTLTTF